MSRCARTANCAPASRQNCSGRRFEKSWSGKLAFNVAIRSTNNLRVAGCASAPNGLLASIDEGEFRDSAANCASSSLASFLSSPARLHRERLSSAAPSSTRSPSRLWLKNAVSADRRGFSRSFIVVALGSGPGFLAVRRPSTALRSSQSTQVPQTLDTEHGNTSLRGGCQRRSRGDLEATTSSICFGQASKSDKRRAHLNPLQL